VHVFLIFNYYYYYYFYFFWLNKKKFENFKAHTKEECEIKICEENNGLIRNKEKGS